MALALNYLKKVDMPLNKETPTKPSLLHVVVELWSQYNDSFLYWKNNTASKISPSDLVSCINISKWIYGPIL